MNTGQTVYEQLEDLNILFFALGKLSIDTYGLRESMGRLDLNTDSLVEIYKRREDATILIDKQDVQRIDKVLEDMENIKFHCDMRYCNWEECKQQIKQSILNHIPTK